MTILTTEYNMDAVKTKNMNVQEYLFLRWYFNDYSQTEVFLFFS